MQPIKNITIGADIELFLQDKATKEFISAEDYVFGTKQDPFIFDQDNKYFATSLDNVLAEFGIPPAKSAEEFHAHIAKSINYINNTIPQEFCTVAVPSARIPERWLRTYNSRLFGCEPDYNAYTRSINQPPFAEDESLRSAGGHVHIGYDNAANFDADTYESDEERCTIIKALDLFIGVPSVILEPDNERKELYGKAGCYRPKRYGVEYRTLSNYYVNEQGRIMWVYNSSMDAVNWLNAGNSVTEDLAAFVQHTINTNHKHDAQTLIKDFNLKIA